MEKLIIATTLSGLFIKKEAWSQAHKLWYEVAAQRLGDPSLMKWVNRPDYFKGVDEVMKRLYPRLSEEERTIEARRMFFDSVIAHIQQKPDLRNDEIIRYFRQLKRKFRLALVTTNTQSALERILAASGLGDLFDIIESSQEEEKDDKRAVFNRFVEKYGKPVVYIGGDRKDSFDYCKENRIPCLFANLEGDKEIERVESVHNLKELKVKLASFS